MILEHSQTLRGNWAHREDCPSRVFLWCKAILGVERGISQDVLTIPQPSPAFSWVTSLLAWLMPWHSACCSAHISWVCKRNIFVSECVCVCELIFPAHDWVSSAGAGAMVWGLTPCSVPGPAILNIHDILRFTPSPRHRKRQSWPLRLIHDKLPWDCAHVAWDALGT